MKKKVLAVLLALTLCVGMAIPALAADFETPAEIVALGAMENGMWPLEEGKYYPELDNIGIPDGAYVFGLFDSGYKNIDFPASIAGYTKVETAEDVTPGTYAAQVVGGSYNYIIIMPATDAPTEEPEEPEVPVAPVADEPSSWAVAYVEAALEAEILPEALQSLYKSNITRADFCALAVALYETVMGEEIADTVEFDDTDDVNVAKMAALGVVNGVGDNKFNPDAGIARQDAATILSRLAAAMDKAFDEAEPTFADNDDIGSWAFDAVGQVQNAEIMGGVGDNTFDPAGAYTREQSIITMVRLFDYMNAEADEEVADEDAEEEVEDAEDAEDAAEDVEETEDEADDEEAAG